MWRKAATLARVEGSARQSLAERFIHCTCVWGLWQVPNREVVPVLGLMEMGLPRRTGTRYRLWRILFVRRDSNVKISQPMNWLWQLASGSGDLVTDASDW